jgi:UDP-2,4-diacetamido-2,4,6-trideoxy-beta-L-altropyranose hydrolase
VHVAIRADGGPDIGYGHLIRTSALTAEVRARGHEVTYATTTPAAVENVCPYHVSVAPLPARGDPAPFVDWLQVADPDVVYTDAYPIDHDYQRIVSDHSSLVVAGDDNRHTICADAFVNGNIYASDLEYDFTGGEPRWCLGSEYLLLRDEVTCLAEQTPPWRERVSEVLVTMGGSDIRGRTPSVVRTLDGLDASVTVVVGPGFSNGEEVRQAVADGDINGTVVETPSNLPDLMFEADMAITACGSTSYELLALGTPSITVVQAANQRLIAEALSSRDLATVLPIDVNSKDLRAATDELLYDGERRRRYRERGRRAVPGHGRAHVCDAVVAAAE